MRLIREFETAVVPCWKCTLIFGFDPDRNAGTGETAKKNLEAFQHWSIVPKRLIKTAGLPDISTELPHIGIKSPAPIAVAPVGVQRIFNPDGELASAEAAARESVPYIMSTASSTSIEDVAKANGNGVRFFQLYWVSQTNSLSSIRHRVATRHETC